MEHTIDIKVESTKFKVIRELSIGGEKLICEYCRRTQVHDIEEFVSVYYVIFSTDQQYKGKVIFGFEEPDENDRHGCKERFFLATSYVYGEKHFDNFILNCYDLLWSYFNKRYTEKTGLTHDGDFNLSEDLRTQTGYDQITPMYDESAYMAHRFEKQIPEHNEPVDMVRSPEKQIPEYRDAADMDRWC